jgi:hypothetical protein
MAKLIVPSLIAVAISPERSNVPKKIEPAWPLALRAAVVG